VCVTSVSGIPTTRTPLLTWVAWTRYRGPPGAAAPVVNGSVPRSWGRLGLDGSGPPYQNTLSCRDPAPSMNPTYVPLGSAASPPGDGGCGPPPESSSFRAIAAGTRAAASC